MTSMHQISYLIDPILLETLISSFLLFLDDHTLEKQIASVGWVNKLFQDINHIRWIWCYSYNLFSQSAPSKTVI